MEKANHDNRICLDADSSESLLIDPGVVMVGSGLAGLVAAVKIKRHLPDQSVLILEKKHPQSNTQLSGGRFRAGIVNRRESPAEEIAELLGSRNDGIVTTPMLRFASVAERELREWQSFPDFVDVADQKNWFGPQWGKSTNKAGSGRGKSVLSWFKNLAKQEGVIFLEGEANRLNIDSGRVESINFSNQATGQGVIRADHFVLANGSIGGKMYSSTNRWIDKSAIELAFDAGLDIVDNTLHMLHPFGNCGPDGKTKIGCYETDALEGTKVYLDGLSEHPIYDVETTELLQDHLAHYHMESIANRFKQYGSVVLLKSVNNRQAYARVSHHYAHASVDTHDGIRVKDIANLSAVGDASGLGYWTNHQPRYSGFALLKCLADGQFLVESLEQRDVKKSPTRVDRSINGATRPVIDDRKIAQLNSRYLDEWISTPSNSHYVRRSVAAGWLAALQERYNDHFNTLSELSLSTAHAHRVLSNIGVSEPFSINKQIAEHILGEPKVVT